MQNDVNNFARNAKKNIIASNEKRKIISNAKMKIIDIGYQQCKMNISISLKKTSVKLYSKQWKIPTFKIKIPSGLDFMAPVRGPQPIFALVDHHVPFERFLEAHNFISVKAIGLLFLKMSSVLSWKVWIRSE